MKKKTSPKRPQKAKPIKPAYSPKPARRGRRSMLLSRATSDSPSYTPQPSP